MSGVLSSMKEIPFCHSTPSPNALLFHVSLPPAHGLVPDNSYGSLRILECLDFQVMLALEMHPQRTCFWIIVCEVVLK